MTLIDQANAIIDQKAHTDEDITTLQKIKYKMSVEYDKVCNLAGSTEQNYNLARSNKFIQLRKTIQDGGKRWSIEDCREAARAEAEVEHGEYTAIKEKARGMKAIIDAIGSICIDYYSKQKNTLDFAR